jgi:hypothetical protein
MQTYGLTTIDDCPSQADLYDLYLDYNGRAREEIVARTSPGSYRQRLLAQFRPLPREHFEAHLERLQGDPRRLAAAIRALQRGFED